MEIEEEEDEERKKSKHSGASMTAPEDVLTGGHHLTLTLFLLFCSYERLIIGLFYRL